MKIAVVVFPGSNCDVDLYEALHSVCHAEVLDQIVDTFVFSAVERFGTCGGFDDTRIRPESYQEPNQYDTHRIGEGIDEKRISQFQDTYFHAFTVPHSSQQIAGQIKQCCYQAGK